MKAGTGFLGLIAIACLAWIGGVKADGSGNPAVDSVANGRYLDKEGHPTYRIQPDGTVDWFTYSGFRRYHAHCHVCHGPDGEGSSYAPALTESLKTLSYREFLYIVANGRKNVTTSQMNVMPALGHNRDVVCYVDDMFVYLRARADGAIERGRPAKHEDKSEMTEKAERSCRG
jgi:methanol metabolism-related c-type cytochrome